MHFATVPSRWFGVDDWPGYCRLTLTPKIETRFLFGDVMEYLPDSGVLRSRVLARLSRWAELGQRTTSNGTMQVGRVPHIAPEAWLHEIYAPLPDAGRAAVSDALPPYIGSKLRLLHSAFNGLNLFSSKLFLYGKRAHYDRLSSDVLPWDLVSANRWGKRKLVGGALLVGGSGVLPGGVDFVERADGTVDALDRAGGYTHLFTWPDLPTCIWSEVSRLDSLFDESGRVRPGADLTNFEFKVSLQ